MEGTKMELINAFVSGDFKSIPGILFTKCLDISQMEQLFLDAGADITCYERDGSEESELRAIAFGEDNMRMLAKHMHGSADDFLWFDHLHDCVRALLSGNAMTEDNKKFCEQHFCDVIETRLRSVFPQICERSMLSSISSEVSDLGAQMERMTAHVQRIQNVEEMIREIMHRQEEQRIHQRQEHSDHAGAGTGQSGCAIPKWHLRHREVKGIWRPEAEQETEIGSLIEAWSKEREDYPGWYILPWKECEKLSSNTSVTGLLQSHKWMDGRTMLLFVFELVWRYEKCLHPYNQYEWSCIDTVWENYAAVISEQCESKSDRRIPDGMIEDVKKWFYIGQALLRIFRENGEDAEWKRVYGRLKHYENYGTNGETELQLEKAKYEYHHLNLAGLRRELNKCRPKKEQYEQRLQILGLRVECGETRAVIPELEQLIRELEEACLGKLSDDHRVFCLTLRTCMLQLLSLCIQGLHDYMEDYEACQEYINQLLAEMEHQKSLFDWSSWKEYVEYELLTWQTKQNKKSESFDLNRETFTMFGGTWGCTAAYRFYRVLERLALPLRCGYVSLLGSLEQPWMDALLGESDRLGLFMVIRGNRSDTVKELINRDYVTGLDQNRGNEITAFLIRALDVNTDEFDALDRDMAGNLITRIQENVPELLIRFMSRCPEPQQQNAMLLLKKLMEDEELPIAFPMASLMLGILDRVSEKIKAQMFGVMLGTAICEHKTLYGHGDGLDLFDYYFRKKDLGPWKQYCAAEPSVVDRLLEHGSDTLYVWRTKVMRLDVLNELGLLNDNQRWSYGELIWSRVSERTGLPDLPNMHLFAYEILPCVDPAIPVRSVKGYFLNQRLCDQWGDKDGCRLTMGEVAYLDELILLCQNMDRNYWSMEEAETLLQNILEDCETLKEKWMHASENGFMKEEYRQRLGKMVRAMAAVCRNVTAPLEEALNSRLNKMVEELQPLGISTKELEVQITNDSALVDRIIEEMRSPDSGLTAGALSAAYVYMEKHPLHPEARRLFDELLAILRYRKNPGLVSAVWVLHNLAYMKSAVLCSENMEAVDKELERLAEAIQLDQDTRGLRVKDILNIRRACMALAFQLYHWDDRYAGQGVCNWKELAAGNEVNEVKNEWLYGG